MKYIAEGITIDEDLCGGKPTIRGMRITVNTILGLLSVGETREELFDSYPFLNEEDIRNCLKYASELVDNYKILETVA